MPPATPAPGLPVEPARSAAEQVAWLRQHARDDVHPVPERRLQRLRLLLGGPPVLGLHRARPLEAQQRQYRRRREDQLDRSEPVHDRAQAREVARGHLAQGQAAGGEDVAVAGAEGGEQAGSGVVHRGAGEADDEASRFGGQGEEEQLAQPEGRGMRGVAVVVVDEVRSARLRGLDVGGPGAVLVDQEHPSRYRATGRVLDGGRQRLAAEGVAEHVEEPGTAVRHGRQHEVVVRRRGGPPAGHRHRRLLGGQRPGEPGRGEDDAHTVMLAGPRSSSELRWLSVLGLAGARTDTHLSSDDDSGGRSGSYVVPTLSIKETSDVLPGVPRRGREADRQDPAADRRRKPTAAGIGPDTKAGEVVSWLKTTYGIGHGHANAMMPCHPQRTGDRRQARRHDRDAP